jgi:hypothetical protein
MGETEASPGARAVQTRVEARCVSREEEEEGGEGAAGARTGETDALPPPPPPPRPPGDDKGRLPRRVRP